MSVAREVGRDEAQQVSDLIGELYDAALDPSLWSGALLKIRNYVGGSSAGLFAKDAAAKSGDLFYDDGGIAREYTDLYFNKYIKFDPATTRHFFARLEEPFATADLMDYAEFQETRFFQEWAKPQKLVDFITAVVDKTTTSVTMVGVFRSERDGIADENSKQRMRLVAPHVRRAVLIGKVIDLRTKESAAFADTLDGLSAGMFMVDGAGRIAHANSSGLSILATADFLREIGGRLDAPDPAVNDALREVFAAAAMDDTAVGVKGVAIPMIARDGKRHVAHVLPLTSGARRRAGRSYDAVAAVFVHEAALDTPSPPEIIARTYKLTPTELRVLLAVVEIGGAPEVAEALGIGETTVKTHLGHLYEKTGARRHADLVKLVAGFASPLTH